MAPSYVQRNFDYASWMASEKSLHWESSRYNLQRQRSLKDLNMSECVILNDDCHGCFGSACSVLSGQG
jgi:hypothetical protein